MTMQRRPSLLANLRTLDDHYGHIEPNPAFERRLQNRLQAAVEKKSPPISASAWLRNYGRPVAITMAACLVLLLAVSEQAPPARSGLVLPHVSDGFLDPVETPADERVEQAKPHRQKIPQTPLTSSPEPYEPAPNEWHREIQPVFPAWPENETLPERNLIEQRRNLVPAPFSNTPEYGARDRSDGFGFWSPAQAFAVDPSSRSSGTNGELRSPGSNRPKPAPTSPAETLPPVACVASDVLKKHAIIDCEENGMVLVDIVYLNPCEDGLFQHAEHECAEIAANEETCTTDTLTNGDACMDPSDLKMYALKMCQSDNKDLVEFTYSSDDCGWKTRKATYTCCPFAPEPPPPAPSPPLVCQAESLGDGVTCKDPGVIKEEALLLCDKLGLMLVDVQMVINCPNNQASIAKIMCCSK